MHEIRVTGGGSKTVPFFPECIRHSRPSMHVTEVGNGYLFVFGDVPVERK